MFGGPDQRIRAKAIAPRYLDSRIYGGMPVKSLSAWVKAIQSVDADAYWNVLDTIPREWKTPRAMTAFARFLMRFLDKNFSAIIIERMDTMNRVFLRLRSEGKPAWRAHCYGHFFSEEADESNRTVVDTGSARQLLETN